MRRDWPDAPSVLRIPVLSVRKWDERHCAKAGKQAGSVEGGLHPEAFGGGQGRSHLTGPKLKAMKRRKTMMQTTFLFPDPNLSSLF